jgi:hypothetical protein
MKWCILISPPSYFLTCICLTARLFRMTLVTVQSSWRHAGASDHYWYVYHVSLDEFQCFSKRYPSYALCKHMCGSAGCGGVGKQWTKATHCSACYYSIVLQVWLIPTSMPLESKRRQNTINNTDWNVSCYCNLPLSFITRYTYCCYACHFYAYRLYFINMWHVYELPKTYTWSGTFILKDGRYTFTLLSLFPYPSHNPLPHMCLRNASDCSKNALLTVTFL